MAKDKSRHTVWMKKETWKTVKDAYKGDNCSSQSEYIEKAVEFYTGYLNARSAGAYLLRVLADVLEGKLLLFGDRVDKLLFKMAVEIGIMQNIIAADTDIDLQTLEKLRALCVRNATDTHGSVGFDDALIFQKRLD